MDNEKIGRFCEMLKECDSAVFFGGAGVSTESGVKDYRSEDGLYNTVKEYGVPPERILSHTFLFTKPEIFYDFYNKYFLKCEASPNDAHYALKRLEDGGRLKAVITQNIDCLHQKAGSKNVLELHGTAGRYYCSKCHKEYPLSFIKELDGKVPYCDKCKGMIRPDVVMYEESLNDDTVRKSVEAISNADLLIVGGTSLSVYPAASFLSYFRGKYIVLINKTETPYDNNADLVFRESIGKVLKTVTEKVV